MALLPVSQFHHAKAFIRRLRGRADPPPRVAHPLAFGRSKENIASKTLRCARERGFTLKLGFIIGRDLEFDTHIAQMSLVVADPSSKRIFTLDFNESCIFVESSTLNQIYIGALFLCELNELCPGSLRLATVYESGIVADCKQDPLLVANVCDLQGFVCIKLQQLVEMWPLARQVVNSMHDNRELSIEMRHVVVTCRVFLLFLHRHAQQWRRQRLPVPTHVHDCVG